jgi:glycosyltransferase involved in cell wall biosynthesis
LKDELQAAAGPAGRSGNVDLAIVGTVGLPARYGGFETLAHELSMRFAAGRSVLVYCTRHGRTEFPPQQGSVELDYVNWNANGWQSIPYDIVCLWRAVRRRAKTVLVLGVSGGLLIPLLRILAPDTKFVTNVDGVEWKREKWGALARFILKVSERFAVRGSHTIVADNQGIVEHVRHHYGSESVLIAYGGDNETGLLDPLATRDTRFPAGEYCFTVCRIEPENHIHLILQAFSAAPEKHLAIVGNWNISDYARSLREKFSQQANIELLDPIYDQSRLHRLRREASAYIHGHSAGGTNPSLVEAMFSGVPILAFDISYNRYTTEDRAAYWQTPEDLRQLITTLNPRSLEDNGVAMKAVAQRSYTWSHIAKCYASILFPSVGKNV